MKKKSVKATGRKASSTARTKVAKRAKATKIATAAPPSHVALKGTIPKKSRKAELKHIPWSSVKVEPLKPLLGLHFVVGQNIMLARVLLQKGCVVPEHSHPNEQITFIAEGALKFHIDGKDIVVNAGEVLTIPPNMPHMAEAIEDTVDFDVFNPPRADWMNKTNNYLR
jgi:quercetin dioxygenase-like cupin family protein